MQMQLTAVFSTSNDVFDASGLPERRLRDAQRLDTACWKGIARRPGASATQTAAAASLQILFCLFIEIFKTKIFLLTILRS